MKNRRFWLGMLVIALVFGMTVVGCEKEAKPDPHKITINELSGKTGNVSVLLYSYLNSSGVVAGGQGTISNNSITVSLQGTDREAWAGSGSYHILMQIEDDTFAYTNGQTLVQLGITTGNDLYSKLPKYNITGSTTTISFSKFLDVSGL
jgi:heme A synthase